MYTCLGTLVSSRVCARQSQRFAAMMKNLGGDPRGARCSACLSFTRSRRGRKGRSGAKAGAAPKYNIIIAIRIKNDMGYKKSCLYINNIICIRSNSQKRYRCQDLGATFRSIHDQRLHWLGKWNPQFNLLAVSTESWSVSTSATARQRREHCTTQPGQQCTPPGRW